MQNQRPILVFAQSARFIAESATLAGFTVWVADCYGDVDTRRCAERYLKLPPFPTLAPEQLLSYLEQLSQEEDCLLICGTGIEKYYPILDTLPDNIKLIGPDAKTISLLKHPASFFQILETLNIQSPETSITLPSSPSGWLRKSSSGYGGSHVERLETISSPSADDAFYYQKFISGTSASAGFISNGTEVNLLTVNRQLHASNFQLTAIEQPFHLSERLQQQLQDILTLICKQTGLIGMNSIDFIVANNEIFILEINPRISASFELLRQPVIKWHIQACAHASITGCTLETNQHQHLLQYIYAENTLVIPDNFPWPSRCHDIPLAGTPILSGEPICTLIITEDSLEKCHFEASHLKTFLVNKLSVYS